MKIKENILTDKLYKDLYRVSSELLKGDAEVTELPTETTNEIIKKLNIYFESVVSNHLQLKYRFNNLLTINNYKRFYRLEYRKLILPFSDVLQDYLFSEARVILYSDLYSEFKSKYHKQSDKIIYEEAEIFPLAMKYYKVKIIKSYAKALELACKKLKYTQRGGAPLFVITKKKIVKSEFLRLENQFTKWRKKRLEFQKELNKLRENGAGK